MKKKLHILKKGEISVHCSECDTWLKVAYGNMVYCKCGMFENERKIDTREYLFRVAHLVDF